MNFLNKITIAYLGNYGSQSYLAAKFFSKNAYNLIFNSEIQAHQDKIFEIQNLFNRIISKILSPRLIAIPNNKELVKRVKNGEFDFGVLPYEASKIGEIKETNEIFIKDERFPNKNLDPCGLVTLPTHISLFQRKNNEIIDSKFKYIVTDNITIKQIKKSIKDASRTFKDYEFIEVEDASIGAKRMSKGEYSGNTALFCSKESGKHYNLEEVFQNFESDKTNHTSFVLFTAKRLKNI